MNIDDLNNQSIEQAHQTFKQCCTSSSWVADMVAARPFENEQVLKMLADDLWQTQNQSDYLEAFEGHPKIGDVNSLRDKYANTKELASNEQGLVQQASDRILSALAQGNRDYEQKFGFIFIVCATGKSAKEMLSLLEERLPNTKEQEYVNAAEEQRKIFQIRIDKVLANG